MAISEQAKVKDGYRQGAGIQPVSRKRHQQQKLMFALMALGMLLVIVPTLYIFGALLVGGWRQITFAFLTQAPQDGGASGGIGPAILGTLALMIGTIILALPLGVFAAIYLTEYARKGPMVRLIHLAIVNLAGVPSIVHGLFGLVLFKLFFGRLLDDFYHNQTPVWQNRTLIWGAATLAILVLPIIITATEEALQSVPRSFREGSTGLGASRWQTIWRIILPAALPGILTGGILAVGRAAGETAPILFTAAVSFTTLSGIPNLYDPVLALPYHLYYVVTQVANAPIQLQYGIALTLLLLVFVVNLSAILLRGRLRRARRW
jgi:phosphate transport system permease protein